MGKDSTRPRNQEEEHGQRSVVSVGGRDRDTERLFFEGRVVEQGETKRDGDYGAYSIYPWREPLRERVQWEVTTATDVFDERECT